jgi:hypothetical protein
MCPINPDSMNWTIQLYQQLDAEKIAYSSSPKNSSANKSGKIHILKELRVIRQLKTYSTEGNLELSEG